MKTFNPVLPDRWTISPRLMACFTFEDGSTIECDRSGEYRIQDENGTEIISGTDYSPSPLCNKWDSILSGLVGFLSHAAESYRYNGMGDIPDDGWIFNAETDEWAYIHSDELEITCYELENEER